LPVMGFRVQSVWGLGFKVSGLGLRVYDLRFRIEGVGLRLACRV
jgi:hypothetical protein